MDIAFVILVVVFGLTGIVYVINFLLLFRNKPTKSTIKVRFSSSLNLGFHKGVINTLDDVVDIYKGISLVKEEEDYRNNLGLLLRQALVELITKKGDGSREAERFNAEVIDKLTSFIRLNETLAPYADLPLEERTIFNDIAIFMEKKDTDSIKRKILELQGTIKARYDDLERIKNINSLTVPLTIISLILTVFFGIVAWDNTSLSEIWMRFLP